MFIGFCKVAATAPTVSFANGTLNGTTTWSTDTVKVTGDITIPAGSKLIINPKTYVKFMGWYRINCNGNMQAIGNTPDSIIFAVFDTTMFSKPDTSKGSWRGIIINNTQVVSVFDKCIFKNIKRTTKETGSFLGGIQVIGRKGYFVNCRFTNNITSGGVISAMQVTTDSIEVNNSLFSYNIGNSNNSVVGNTVCTWINTIAILKNNTFIGNKPYTSGNGTYTVTTSYSDNCIIQNNTFKNNYNSFYGGALGGVFANNTISGDKGSTYLSTAYNSNISIINNQFLNNSGGISLSGSSDFIGNIVYKSTGGVYFNINSQILNNDFIYNGNAVNIAANTQPIFNNNIFWRNNSNGNQIYISNFAEPQFNNCLLQKGANGISRATYANFPAVFNNIINQKPAFVDSTSNFSLQDTSICVNKGIANDASLKYTTDVYGNKRLSNGMVDIGAVEKYFGNINVCSNITTNTQWIADTIKVNCNININSSASLTIAPGTIIMVAPGKVINVYGPITAIGNASYPIIFSCQDTIGFYKATPEGVWQGLNFYNFSGKSQFDYVTIQYAFSPLALNLIQDLSVSNSIIRYNKGNTNNNWYSSKITFTNTLFYKNQCEIFSAGTNIIFDGCRFFNNYYFYVSSGPNVKYTNTIFANNANIELDFSDFIMTNCLFVKNSSFRIGYSNPTVSNTIFNEYIDLYGTLSNPVFYNCLFNNNSNIPGSNNMYNKSINFMSPSKNTGTSSDGLSANWRLKSTSVCVNAGANSVVNTITPSNDIEGNPRIVGSLIDLGPYENQSSVPIFTVQPVGGNLCTGNSITLSALVNDTVSYQWQKNGQNIMGATKNTLQLTAVSNNDQGNYVCKASNSFGETFSSTVLVNINPAPEILSIPDNKFIGAGTSINLSIPVIGAKPITYTWTKDGILQPLLNKPELKFASFNSSNEGSYQLSVQNSCGSDTSPAFALSIIPEIHIRNNDTLLCEDEQVSLLTNISNGSTFQWYKNGNLLDGETSDSIWFARIKTSDEGSYSCYVQSAAGSYQTNAILLSVKQKPHFTVQPSSEWIPENASLTTEVAASGSSPLSYQWYRDDVAINGEKSSRLLFAGFTKNDEKVYKCVVGNDCGTDTSLKAAFMISPVVLVNTTNKEPVICESSSVDFSVYSKFSSTYQWKKDGQILPGATLATYTIQKASELSKGNYSCTIANIYGKTETSPLFLQVLTKPAITADPTSQWVNAGTEFNLHLASEGSKPVKFNWYKNNNLLSDSLPDIQFSSFSSSNEGKYVCVISNTCGSDTSKPAKIVVAPELVNKNGDVVCENDTFELNVVFSNDADVQWFKDGNLLSKKGKTLLIDKSSAKNVGNYSCRVSNQYGNAVLGPVQLSIAKAPSVELLPNITYVDESLQASIEPIIAGDAPLQIQWYKNGISLKNQSQSSLLLNKITKGDEGQYKCKISNICGSIETNETKLAIAPQICMVSNYFAKDSNRNMIVWDRNSSFVYDHFNVYREGFVKDKYVKIGKVPYKDITFFVDTTVNPKSQAFVYKITAADAIDSVETDINATSTHKTIHLLVTQGIPKGIQLDWDEYIGFDYGTYKIYRSVENGKFENIYNMASTSRTWTDFNAPNTKNLKYYVAVDRSTPCSADKLGQKAGAGPFASAVSNMEDNSRLKFTATGIADIQNGNISVYPNPFSETANIRYRLESNTSVSINITDLSGRLVEKLVNENQSTGVFSLQVGNYLNPGTYLLQVRFGNENKVIQMLKIK
jgi:hypothetical protein